MKTKKDKVCKAMADHHESDMEECVAVLMERYPKRFTAISNSELRSLLTAAFICGVSAQVNNPVEEEQLQDALTTDS